MGGGTAEEAAYFIPASVADSAFLPSDSSLVDLMGLPSASPALQIDRLLLAIDTREQTATGRPLMTAERTIGLHAGTAGGQHRTGSPPDQIVCQPERGGKQTHICSNQEKSGCHRKHLYRIAWQPGTGRVEPPR